MFDRFREAEVITVSGPDGGPAGYAYKVVQGKSIREEFPAAQQALANETASKINQDVLAKNPRRFALLAVAATVLTASGAAVGIAGIYRGEHPSDDGDSSAGAPVPTETLVVTSTTTEFVTESPTPIAKFKLSPVRLTLLPKAQHPHRAHHTSQSVPEAQASSSPPSPEPYVPPQTAYTAPPVSTPPHHPPHLIVRHLNDKN